MQNAGLVIKRLLLGAILALIATYVCDFLYFHWRMSRAKPGIPLETFTAPRLYAIAEKNGKVEYELDAQNPEQTITCCTLPVSARRMFSLLVHKTAKPEAHTDVDRPASALGRLCR